MLCLCTTIHKELRFGTSFRSNIDPQTLPSVTNKHVTACYEKQLWCVQVNPLTRHNSWKGLHFYTSHLFGVGAFLTELIDF